MGKQRKQKLKNLEDKVSNTIFLEQQKDRKNQNTGEQEEGIQTKSFSPNNFHRRVSKPSRYQGHLKNDLDIICKNQEETKTLIQQPYFFIENANLNQTKAKSKMDYLMLANYNTAQWKEILENALKSTPEDTVITSGKCIITREMKEEGNYTYYIQFESESETRLKNHLLKDREEAQERTTIDNMEKGINNGKGMFKDFSLEIGMAKSAREWRKANKKESENVHKELLVDQIKEMGILLRTEKGNIDKNELPSVFEDMNQYCDIINKILDADHHNTAQVSVLKQQQKLTKKELEQYRTVLEFEGKVEKAKSKWEVLEKLGNKYKTDIKPFKSIWTAFEEKLSMLGKGE